MPSLVWPIHEQILITGPAVHTGPYVRTTLCYTALCVEKGISSNRGRLSLPKCPFAVSQVMRRPCANLARLLGLSLCLPVYPLRSTEYTEHCVCQPCVCDCAGLVSSRLMCLSTHHPRHPSPCLPVRRTAVCATRRSLVSVCNRTSYLYGGAPLSLLYHITTPFPRVQHIRRL